jgi:hypothetical protein
MKKSFYQLVALCIVSTAGFGIYFQCNRLLIIRLKPRYCGMGNQMFRYAAGMGLAERNPDFYVCWHGWDSQETQHPNSFFLSHMDPITILPECPFWTALMGELLLVHFAPPFSKYIPFAPNPVSGSSTIVTGEMEVFRYFPSGEPLFHLKAYHAARRWMLERNLTSAIHVRRGDYALYGYAAPLGFFMRNMVPRAVVVTDDPNWVKFHRSVFEHCVLSEDHDPGFDMALLAAATDTVVIGEGTFAWWGAYLSKARRVVYYGRQAGYQTSAYVESDRMPAAWFKRY